MVGLGAAEHRIGYIDDALTLTRQLGPAGMGTGWELWVIIRIARLDDSLILG
ncbi:MAG: hypothetical protein WBH47_19660 [Streptosporangiaceae bacterium]